MSFEVKVTHHISFCMNVSGYYRSENHTKLLRYHIALCRSHKLLKWLILAEGFTNFSSRGTKVGYHTDHMNYLVHPGITQLILDVLDYLDVTQIIPGPTVLSGLTYKTDQHTVQILSSWISFKT